MDLRQGPLRVPLRHVERAADHAAGPRRGRHAAAGVLARGVGGGRRRPGRGARRGRGRGAARRPADRRGRLRLRQVRPRGAGHERRRRPRPCALRRGAGVPGDDGGRHRPGPRRGDLRRAGFRARRPARGLRARGGVADRLPAAAPGGAHREGAGLRPRPLPDTGRAEAAGHGPHHAARRRGPVAAGPGARHLGRPRRRRAADSPAPSSSRASGWPRCPVRSPPWSSWREATGARIAWVPRRAGERGAVEAGALPALLPGGRAVADEAARAEVAGRWGVDAAALPSSPGLDTTGILTAVRDRRLAGLLVGGVDPADLPDPLLAENALAEARFVVSLEMFPTAVTEWADVVLPVAAAAEKAGSYLDWEGRVRSFDATLHDTGRLSDARVLHGLADLMDVDLRLPTPEAARAELAALGTARSAGVAGPDVAAAGAPSLRADEALLASWRQLLDAGTLQRDEPELSGTARRAVVRLAPEAAARLGAVDGDPVTVTGPAGSITLPLLVTPMPDHVVWLPMRSAGSQVRTDLGAGPGAVVRLAASSAGLLHPAPRLEVSRDAPGQPRPAHPRGLRQRRLVDRAHQGRRGLRGPGAPDAVRDRLRAQGRRAHAAADRPQPGRPAWLPAEPRGRAEAGVQGRHHAGARRQADLLPGPGPGHRPGVPRLLGHPAGADRQHLRRAHPAAAHRRPHRRAGRARLLGDGHLRHRPGRLGLRLHLPAARLAAQRRADGQLRDRDGSVDRRGVPLRRLDVDVGDRRRPGRRQPGLLLRTRVHRPRAGTPSCSRSPSSSTRSPWSARPTGRPSTSPRPRASWSAASTPSTRR